jgi:hypothetical protein
MPIAVAAENDKREDGAPIPPGTIDPELVKLRRTRSKIGIITAAGVVGMCVYFLLRLGPDRKFAGEGEKPTAIAISDVLGDRIAPNSFVEVEAEPLVGHAIRSVKTRGDVGLRVVPVRGTGDRLWLALPGDAWDPPVIDGRYTGRLRKLGDLALAPSVKGHVEATPRPLFATAAAVRAGLASGRVKTVTGDDVVLTDAHQIAFDIVEPNAATIVVSFIERFPDMRSWGGAMKRAEIDVKPGTPKPSDEALGQGRYEVAMSVDEAQKKLQAAELWAARVEPVKRHRAGTWGDLKKSGADGLALGGAVTPDAQVDLVGIYVQRPIPDDAYALLTTESPKDYWYVLPITIALAVIGLLFAWALVRAIRRDLLPSTPLRSPARA